LYEKYERLLEKTGETTYQVCKATNIPESTISMWRDRCVNQGKDAKLSIDNLAKLAKHFGVPIEYFLKN
jgi:transcriptional regulator with XRE-family HTH domain